MNNARLAMNYCTLSELVEVKYLISQVLSPGTFLDGGKYSINSLIGQGGFSFVYCAFDKANENVVAIKEFFPHQYLFRDEETKKIKPISNKFATKIQYYLSCFMEEREIVSKINHPGVVKIVDSFFENQTAYLVMEFIQGKSLSQQVAQFPDMYINQNEKVFEVISKLIDILSSVHQESICHLDISPDNILVTSHEKIVLIDFGSSLTQLRRRKVQPKKHKYAPIEVIRNKNIGIESDIFQLGMTIHELLLGYLPPSASKRISKIKKTGRDPWKSSNLREPWKTLISQAIALDKNDRPSSLKDWWN